LYHFGERQLNAATSYKLNIGYTVNVIQMQFQMSLERRVISFLTGCMTTPVSIRTAIYIDQTTTMLIALICAILFIADIGIHTQIAFVAVLVDIHHCL